MIFYKPFLFSLEFLIQNPYCTVFDIYILTTLHFVRCQKHLFWQYLTFFCIWYRRSNVNIANLQKYPLEILKFRTGVINRFILLINQLLCLSIKSIVWEGNKKYKFCIKIFVLCNWFWSDLKDLLWMHYSYFVLEFSVLRFRTYVVLDYIITLLIAYALFEMKFCGMYLTKKWHKCRLTTSIDPAICTLYLVHWQTHLCCQPCCWQHRWLVLTRRYVLYI